MFLSFAGILGNVLNDRVAIGTGVHVRIRPPTQCERWVIVVENNVVAPWYELIMPMVQTSVHRRFLAQLSREVETASVLVRTLDLAKAICLRAIGMTPKPIQTVIKGDNSVFLLVEGKRSRIVASSSVEIRGSRRSNVHSLVLGQCVSKLRRRYRWLRRVSKPKKLVDMSTTTLLLFKLCADEDPATACLQH